MKKLIIIALMMLSSVVHAQCPNPSMKEAAVFDFGTTAIGLAEGASELNPFGLLGTTIAKAFILYNEDELTPPNKAITSAIWTGAGVNNLMILFGAAVYPAVLTGILAGIFVKANNNCEKEQ